LATLRGQSTFRLPPVKWRCLWSPFGKESEDRKNQECDKIGNQQQSEIHKRVVIGVGGVVEERLHRDVNDAKEEDRHDDNVLYNDEVVPLFVGAGLGHHEERKKQDKEDRNEEDDGGCAAEIVPLLNIGAGWIRPDSTYDCADDSGYDEKMDKTGW